LCTDRKGYNGVPRSRWALIDVRPLSRTPIFHHGDKHGQEEKDSPFLSYSHF
jgi:hypothetical protein